MTQVEQDHIGSVSRGVMIEGDRAFVTRHRVVEAVVAGITPGTGQLRQPEAVAVEPGRGRCLAQVLVVGEPKCGADDAFHSCWRQIELGPALCQSVGELLQVARKLAVDFQLRRCWRGELISTSAVCQSARLPSIFCSTWAAITSPALPRSSRI